MEATAAPTDGQLLLDQWKRSLTHIHSLVEQWVDENPSSSTPLPPEYSVPCQHRAGVRLGLGAKLSPGCGPRTQQRMPGQQDSANKSPAMVRLRKHVERSRTTIASPDVVNARGQTAFMDSSRKRNPLDDAAEEDSRIASLHSSKPKSKSTGADDLLGQYLNRKRRKKQK